MICYDILFRVILNQDGSLRRADLWDPYRIHVAVDQLTWIEFACGGGWYQSLIWAADRDSAVARAEQMFRAGKILTCPPFPRRVRP